MKSRPGHRNAEGAGGGVGAVTDLDSESLGAYKAGGRVIVPPRRSTAPRAGSRGGTCGHGSAVVGGDGHRPCFGLAAGIRVGNRQVAGNIHIGRIRHYRERGRRCGDEDRSIVDRRGYHGRGVVGYGRRDSVVGTDGEGSRFRAARRYAVGGRRKHQAPDCRGCICRRAAEGIDTAPGIGETVQGGEAPLSRRIQRHRYGLRLCRGIHIADDDAGKW